MVAILPRVEMELVNLRRLVITSVSVMKCTLENFVKSVNVIVLYCEHVLVQFLYVNEKVQRYIGKTCQSV